MGCEMADWQRKLILNPEWGQAQRHEISTQELARSVAIKLRKLAPFEDGDDEYNLEREGLVEEFDGLADDKTATQTDFNYVMQSLYDWGDQRMDGDWNGKKVCWVDTMTTVDHARALRNEEA